MAAIVPPGGDDEPVISEQEFDILKPKMRRGSDSEPSDSEQPRGQVEKPKALYLPYDPISDEIKTSILTNVLVLNSIKTHQQFAGFLDSNGRSEGNRLTAALKYSPGVCQKLVDKVVSTRVFNIKSLWLLWFHMNLEDPTAVVPDTEVEIALVRTVQDLEKISSRNQVHRYAFVLEAPDQQSNGWTVIGLKKGLSRALRHLKRLIMVKEREIQGIPELKVDPDLLTAVFSAEDLEYYKNIDVEGWKLCARNQYLDKRAFDLIMQAASLSPPLLYAFTHLSTPDRLHTSDRLLKYGELTEEPGLTVSWELRSGTSGREDSVRKLGKILPYHTFVLCLRFPESTSVALLKLKRVLDLLISLNRNNEELLVLTSIVNVKYVQDGEDACVIFSANFNRAFSIFKTSGHQLVRWVSLLDSLSVLPADLSVFTGSFTTQEPLRTWVATPESDPKGLQLHTQLQWSDLWVNLNRHLAPLKQYLAQEQTVSEVNLQAVNKFLNYWFKVVKEPLSSDEGNSRSALYRRVYSLLQEVSNWNKVTAEAFGPYFHAKVQVTSQKGKELFDFLETFFSHK